MALRLLAPAKLNLHLRVEPPRADGFHPLLTWMCTVGLFDTIELDDDLPLRAARDAGAGGPISLVCDDPRVPGGADNLIVRVARALHADAGAAAAAARGGGPGEGPALERPVVATLHKRIPAGAGLGGGSSDAAHALLGLDRLWRLGWSTQRLSDLAARFGSDLSFFFAGPSAICTGRGEVVRPVDRPRPCAAVLFLPPFAMPTPPVYRRFDEMGLGDAAAVTREPDWAAWSRLPAGQLLPHLANDLEPAAFDLRPDLAALRARAEETVGRPVRMSGSGSALFTLFDTAEDAARTAGLFDGRDDFAAVRAVELAPRIDDDLRPSTGPQQPSPSSPDQPRQPVQTGRGENLDRRSTRRRGRR